MSPKPPETVLLIDDSAFDNKLHKRVIERTGLVQNVLTFTMADDALAYMRREGSIPVDLILLDINMPRMDGFELMDAAIEEFGEAFMPSVVVMLTTSMDPGDQDRAGTYSVVQDYFLKPLTSDKFQQLYRSLSDGQSGGDRAA